MIPRWIGTVVGWVYPQGFTEMTPLPLLDFRSPTSKGREARGIGGGKGGERKERGEGNGRKEGSSSICLCPFIWLRPATRLAPTQLWRCGQEGKGVPLPKGWSGSAHAATARESSNPRLV